MEKHNAQPNIPGASARLYDFEGPWRSRSVCGLQHIRNQSTGKDVIVLTEVPENHGTSVTNFVECLATMIVAELGLDPVNTIIIEHYPERGDEWHSFPETWDLVLPDWVKGIAKVPRTRHMWKSLTRAQAYQLIGCEDLEAETEAMEAEMADMMALALDEDLPPELQDVCEFFI